jgi:hypothetical protein
VEEGGEGRQRTSEYGDSLPDWLHYRMNLPFCQVSMCDCGIPSLLLPVVVDNSEALRVIIGLFEMLIR